ncbi:MAG: efflux RND transporter permease subunit, partial [Pseudomonadota bacterium]
LDIRRKTDCKLVEFKILYDTTKSVRASLKEVLETLALTFMLVVAVTFLFLADWRSTLIPTLAIPVSLIGTFAVLYVVGFSANMITLFAIILAIGVVVDDSIVVVENVQRIMDETGKEPAEATAIAMKEVTGPVVATTLVLLAVFVPVSFMPGITGELYKQFAVTICVAVVISSINALTLAPALCGMVLKRGASQPRGPLAWFSAAVDKTRNGYVRVVSAMLRRVLFAGVVFLAFAGATVYMFQSVPTGFFPYEDKGVFFVNAQLPDGASLKRTEAVTTKIADTLLETEGVTDVISIAGFSLLAGQASNGALVIPVLSDWDQRTTRDLAWYSILGKANAKLAAIAEAEVFAFPIPPIQGLGQSGGIEAQVQDFQGRSPQELAAAVRGLSFAANQNPALNRVFSTYSANVPQLFLDVDRDKAQLLGVSVGEIFQTLQANLGSQYINDFNLFGKIYQVLIQAESNYRATENDIRRIHLRNSGGEMVPISSFIDIKPILGPLAIARYNLFQSASIQGQPGPGASSGDAIAALNEIAKTALPDGYGIEWTGTSREEIEAGGLVA